MLDLSNITISCVNCVDPENGVRAIKYSCKEILFGRRIIFSHCKPTNLSDDIEYIQVPKFTHIDTSHFSVCELTKYINTEYSLSIHDDGFVINPHLWRDEFFQYDYIGAPWPSLPWCSINRVGNGGFVLKSKKFLDLCSKITWNGGHDDVYLTNALYDFFTTNGCKYAPLEVAMKFSLENPIPECNHDLTTTFGFHGRSYTQQFIDAISFLKDID